MHDLHALAQELARPVWRGWLSLDVASAVLLMVALRGQSEVGTAVADAERAQAQLRRAVTA